MQAASYLKQINMTFLFICPEELDQFRDIMCKPKRALPVNIAEKEPQFLKRYTFDSFVVGESNKFAAMTAHTVAENPGASDGLLTLNPFYIYGGVGLGKTHLLHAIGNFIEENSPELNVVYTSADSLSNEYFTSLNLNARDKSSFQMFRKKYASVDVLMIDDVQYFNKRGGAQELVFNIFNDLYSKGKQIILSSDRPPKEINDIEERLRTRFEGGIMCDIYQPSFDTRIEILMKKIRSTGKEIDRDIVYYIAEKITSNVRELEGALSKVIMFATLEKKMPSIEKVKELLKEKDDEAGIDPEKIIETVCDYFGIGKELVTGKSRKAEIVEARNIAIYLVRELNGMPLINIGQLFGGRDHSTIINSRDKVAISLTGTNKNDYIIKDIKEKLGNRN
jgi:chromosomal replication initiator protein